MTPKIDFKIAAIIVARRSRTARQGAQPSLPGLTRQSIIFEDVFSKCDGYAGQARV
jgi:hypothetical protein